MGEEELRFTSLIGEDEKSSQNLKAFFLKIIINK